jgi:hypothetical protein
MASSAKPLIDLDAQCACGAVSVSARGTVLSMLMCSCADCQKATGTGHSAFMLMKADDVAIAGPTRSFERTSNSGARLTRWFCPECGTPLSGRSSRAPQVVILPVGLFGRATADWYRPSQLIFSRSHLEWDTIDPELPRWQTYRDEERGT